MARENLYGTPLAPSRTAQMAVGGDVSTEQCQKAEMEMRAQDGACGRQTAWREHFSCLLPCKTGQQVFQPERGPRRHVPGAAESWTRSVLQVLLALTAALSGSWGKGDYFGFVLKEQCVTCGFCAFSEAHFSTSQCLSGIRSWCVVSC